MKAAGGFAGRFFDCAASSVESTFINGGPTPPREGGTLAKTNYSYEKRQRELARKKKQEEKRQRKATRTEEPTVQTTGGDSGTPVPTTETPPPPGEK